MAIGLLGALLAGGVRVPEDIALAGFDDIPVARYVSPALTTMRTHRRPGQPGARCAGRRSKPGRDRPPR
jgi:DNA-binding LacI/PurR family transcriptional regulator